MQRLLLTVLTLLFMHSAIGAQELLTLERCISIAMENNLSLKSKRGELQKSKYTISENRAMLLPKLNAFANFNDNFDPPVSVTDGSSYGVPYNVTHTLQYNASAGLQLSMPLFNQTIYATMEITKLVDNINNLSYEKAREDLALQIARMYYIGQTTIEQIAIVKSNITRLEELKSITEAFYDNQMVLDIDVKRVDINLQNLRVQYNNAMSMLEQQLNSLKYIIDYPATAEITLAPSDANSFEEVALTGLSPELFELQMLAGQNSIAQQRRSIVSSGYMPSLTLTGNWMYTAFTDELSNWFHSGPSNHWFRSYGLGLSLRVPIFDGFDKKYKLRKADIDITNSRLAQENTQKQLETEYMNATNDLMNHRRNFERQKENCRLAEEVCGVTGERYREGIASMTEVLQDEMRMSEAQNSYLSAYLNYRLANLKLIKLTGRAGQLIPSAE
ncbi:MAG: TolC family protein [Bacteroidaceae bacterium]|nr:TolC family protein [Bacteroidaceae bacterium]MBR5891070.1 TolC family protein [Bacteroidaceae bacterium]